MANHVTRNLLGSRKDFFSVDPENLVVIGLDEYAGKVHKKGEHVLFDERALWKPEENMIRNVMTYGVLESVLVRRDGDRFIVVDGRQRVLAAREANKRLTAAGSEPVLVPVLPPKKGTDGDVFGVMISANEIRRDDDYRTKAEKAKRAADLGHDEDAIAKMFGTSVGSVRNWLAFFDLDKTVQKSIADGEISSTAAVKLAKLPRDEQVQQLEELKAAAPEGKRVTVAKVTGKRAAAADDDKGEAPGKRVLLKLVESKEAKKEFGDEFIRGVRVAIGHLRADRVAGLTAFFNELSAKKAKKPKSVDGKKGLKGLLFAAGEG